MSFPNFQDYQKQTQVFSGLSCVVPTPLAWSGGAEPRQVNGQLVSANYFDMLGLQPAAGRFFLPDEDTKLNGNTVAVISPGEMGQGVGRVLHASGLRVITCLDGIDRHSGAREELREPGAAISGGTGHRGSGSPAPRRA